eukprot:5337598-Alexandrium_andersonii.AAC.1
MVMAAVRLALGILRAHSHLQHGNEGLGVGAMYTLVDPPLGLWLHHIQRQGPVEILTDPVSLCLSCSGVQLSIVLAEQKSDLHLIVELKDPMKCRKVNPVPGPFLKPITDE